MRNKIEDFFKKLQTDILSDLTAFDASSKMTRENWQRPEGGGGITAVVEGNILEKGAVNFSAVHGNVPEKMSKLLNVQGEDFYASGVSSIIHPSNPWVPIIHMNVRYFELPDQGKYWFGGGIDLTPHYINREEAETFHRKLENCCSDFDPKYYPKFKAQADAYFYLPHRAEARGIGGIFFDYLGRDGEGNKEEYFRFVQAVGQLYTQTYLPIVRANKDRSYGERELLWQKLRRGRYVEFNLIWDRGTKFGLLSGGRTESILLSLPATASWQYNHTPDPESLEYETLNMLKHPVDWLKQGSQDGIIDTIKQ